MARGTEVPCPGCGRTIAYRTWHQYRGAHPGKPRVKHKCPHGTDCVFGERHGVQGFNWPRCPECLVVARREYAERHAHDRS